MKSRRTPGKDPWPAEVVGFVVRRLRDQADRTADDVATGMRLLGYEGWTSSVIAALESGRRRLDIEELVGLAAVLGVPVPALFDAPADVSLSASLSVSATELAQMLCGRVPELEEVPVNTELWHTREPTDKWVIDSQGDFEQQLAARIGVPAAALTVIAYHLWERRSPTKERNRRADTPATRQWAARAVREDLEAFLGQGTLRQLLQIVGRARTRLLVAQPYGLMPDVNQREEHKDPRVWALIAAVAEKARALPHGARVILDQRAPEFRCRVLTVRKGISVRLVPHLHAKFLIADDRGVAFSAPFTEAGLSSNFEQLVSVEADFVDDMVKEFEKLWTMGAEPKMEPSYEFGRAAQDVLRNEDLL